MKINRLLPCSFETCLQSLQKTGRLLFAEEVCAAGCVGERLLTAAELRGLSLKAAQLVNLGDGIVTHGSRKELLKLCALDAASLAAAAEKLTEAGA